MDSITLREARVIWTNFSGKEGRYNVEGERFFNVVIDDEELATALIADGWNAKPLKQREEDDAPAWALKVKVNYKSQYPPRVYKINEDGTNKTLLDETTIMLLDLLRVKWADLIINPHEWKNQGRSGVSAYLDNMYAVTETNPLDEEWEDREAATLLGSEED